MMAQVLSQMHRRSYEAQGERKHRDQNTLESRSLLTGLLAAFYRRPASCMRRPNTDAPVATKKASACAALLWALQHCSTLHGSARKTTTPRALKLHWNYAAL